MNVFAVGGQNHLYEDVTSCDVEECGHVDWQILKIVTSTGVTATFVMNQIIGYEVE